MNKVKREDKGSVIVRCIMAEMDAKPGEVVNYPKGTPSWMKNKPRACFKL